MAARRKSPTSQAAFTTLADEDTSWPKPEKRTASEQRADTARYISTIVTELAQMAGHCRLDTLNYLLVMAQLEADVAARRSTLIKL
jgi:hypothetical protein